MYGLLLENLSEYVKTVIVLNLFFIFKIFLFSTTNGFSPQVYGEEKWDEIRRQAGISSPSFGVHEDFDEDILNRLATTSQQVISFIKQPINYKFIKFFRYWKLITRCSRCYLKKHWLIETQKFVLCSLKIFK